MKIAQRTFIVTGGASGLGAAVGAALVAAGGNVVLADIDGDGAARQAQALGARARHHPTDVTEEASARSAVDLAVREFGGLQGLVGCAGIAPAARVLGRDGVHDLDLFARVLRINLLGTFNMIRWAAAAMADSAPDDGGERGVIVSTASIAAFEGQVGQAAYAASKGGVVAMTLPLARELGRQGIRVMTVAPGAMQTPMMDGMPDAVRDSLGQAAAFPARLGHPDEFARLVLHIIDNPYLNGEVIRLDGGMRMAPR